MKNYIYLLLILLLAIFQGALMPLNLILLAVIFLTVYMPTKTTLRLSFSAGLFLDLAKGTALGLSSFWLLVTSFLLIVYGRRFNSRHQLFLAIFTFISSALISRLMIKNFGWNLAFVLALIALVIRLILKWFSLEPNKGIRLKV
jgi:rod shape-determining protein MreD